MTLTAPVVGFDLDLTLVDSRAGFAATLGALGAETGAVVDVGDLARRMGPPLDRLLAEHHPDRDPEALAGLVERFRALYPDHAITPTTTTAGAVDALAAVRSHRGRSVVVTGKYAPNARRHVDHLGLDVDALVGEVWGVGKGEALREHGVDVYVGDHVHDVEGARSAGVLSVSVLTGGCTEDELRAAGTDVVLADLTAFPAWFEQHLLERRLAALESDLAALGSLLVAFSGGADSAFLLAAAARALGPDRVVAATAHSPSLPDSERGAAATFAEGLGVRLLTPSTHEGERPGYRANDGDRCFFCKAELLDVLGPLAATLGLAAVATGTNADDALAGFRPGITAAAQRGARTPLLDAGLTKAQVRAASRAWGLPTWDKPAAACLASRIAYGVEVTPSRLARVERAEVGVRSALDDAGIAVRDLRVRDVDGLARLEVDRSLVADVLAHDEATGVVTRVLREAGFARSEVDPLGFRSGSMNELLAQPERHR